MPDYVELTDEFRRAARKAASIVYQYGLSQMRNGVRSEQLEFDTASFSNISTNCPFPMLLL